MVTPSQNVSVEESTYETELGELPLVKKLPLGNAMKPLLWSRDICNEVVCVLVPLASKCSMACSYTHLPLPPKGIV